MIEVKNKIEKMSTYTKVKIIWMAIVAYGALVLLGALVYLFSSQDASEMTRGIVRAFGAALIAYGIYKRVSWMYWVAVIFSGILSLLGAVGLGILVLPLVEGGMALSEVVGAILFLVLSVPLLIASFILLLASDVRDHLLGKKKETL